MKANYTVKDKLRFLGLGLSVPISVLLSAVLGIAMTFRHGVTNAPGAPATAVVERPAPPHDPRKPTAAILLGNTSSELTDVLGPYALFAESDAYNVYTVASSRTIRRLTGGLEVMPQLSYGDLAVRLHGSPDIIVLPAIVDIESPVNLPVLAWLREQAQAHPLLFSWCTGAEVLAASGLIDGKAATAHWGDIGRLERAYPRVRWKRGVRYIDSGMLLTTGGLTCGIDATLHLIKRRNGAAAERKAALAVRYPLSKFIGAPWMPQYQFELADSILLFNAAYRWPKRRAAIWLYDGVGELDLAAIFDVYPASGTVEAYTVSEVASVVSRNGLQFVPRWNVKTLPTMDRVLVPGGDAVTAAVRRLPDGLGGAGVSVKVLATPNMPDFTFKVTLEDLAREHDRPTAVFAAKRLEYRDAGLHLVGRKWPQHLLVLPLIAGTFTFGSLLFVSRWIRKRRQSSR